MTIFVNGKQKRVRRPPEIDGVSVDEFVRNNADPIWLHQNEMWECMEENEYWCQGNMPSTEKEWLEEISRAYLEAFDTIPFGKFVGQKIKPEDLFHLGPAVCLKFRGLEQTKSNLKKATDAALTSYVATKEVVGDLFDIPQMSFSFSYIASHYGLDLVDENMSTNLLEYIEKNLDQLISSTCKNR